MANRKRMLSSKKSSVGSVKASGRRGTLKGVARRSKKSAIAPLNKGRKTISSKARAGRKVATKKNTGILKRVSSLMG